MNMISRARCVRKASWRSGFIGDHLVAAPAAVDAGLKLFSATFVVTSLARRGAAHPMAS